MTKDQRAELGALLLLAADDCEERMPASADLLRDCARDLGKGKLTPELLTRAQRLMAVIER